MDKDLEELVAATRRLGRARRNRKLPGAVARRRRGERLLHSIRESGGLPLPRVLKERPSEEPEPDVCTAIADFGQRLVDTIDSAAVARSQRRTFTPVPGATRDVAPRRPRRRHQTSPAENYGAVGVDRHANKLALAGVAIICFFVVGVTLLTSPGDQGAPSRAIAKKKLPAAPVTTAPDDPSDPSAAPSPPAALAGSLAIDDVE